MRVDLRRSSPCISRFAKTLFVGGALVALAVPAWRTKSLTATFRAPAIATEQDFGQWRPLGRSFRNSGDADPYQSGRVASIAVDPRDPSRWLAGAGNGGV
jgi:hypothetical protein